MECAIPPSMRCFLLLISVLIFRPPPPLPPHPFLPAASPPPPSTPLAFGCALFRYLKRPESQTLISDMIRFIVRNYHPSNEMLASEIIPRYAVIGWLLRCCKNSLQAQNAKLSLFLDWFNYPPSGGNVMVIEPGLLVMHHSLIKYPKITSTLLEFLCLIATEYYPAGGNLLQVSQAKPSQTKPNQTKPNPAR